MRPPECAVSLACRPSLRQRPVTTQFGRSTMNCRDFERLCALSNERFASFRSIICLRFLHALPPETPKRWRPPTSAMTLPRRRHQARPGSLGRGLGLRGIRGKGRRIEQLAFGDDVGFRLCLRVKPLYGCCTERDAGKHSHCDLVLCAHDASSLLIETGQQTACRKPRDHATCKVVAMTDRKKTIDL